MSVPKSQKYPKSVIKVGAVLYRVDAWTDEKTGKTMTEVSDWIVRSIQAIRGSKSRFGIVRTMDSPQFVNITEKVEFITWGKLSKKNGDRGWLKNISDAYRKQFAVGDDLLRGIYTTVLAAAKFAVAEIKDTVAWYKTEIAERPDISIIDEFKKELAEFEAQYVALNRRLAKLAVKPSSDKGRNMDMRKDIFADQTFGKIALKNLASPDANFRLYKAGWLGDGRQREIMSVTGASFREALSGPNKSQLSIMVPHTSRSVHVTVREMDEFEAKEQPVQ